MKNKKCCDAKSKSKAKVPQKKSVLPKKAPAKGAGKGGYDSSMG